MQCRVTDIVCNDVTLVENVSEKKTNELCNLILH